MKIVYVLAGVVALLAGLAIGEILASRGVEGTFVTYHYEER